MFKSSQCFSFLKGALKMYIHFARMLFGLCRKYSLNVRTACKAHRNRDVQTYGNMGERLGEGSQEKLECTVMNIFSWDFYEVRHSVVHEWEVGGKVCRFLLFFSYMLKMLKRAACLLIQSSEANTVSSTL